jgi:DNA-binding transcriptional regulator YdaS (Cro superfamily)
MIIAYLLILIKAIKQMTRRQARDILLNRRGEMAALARKLGCSEVWIMYVTKGREKSPKVLSAAIARATEIQAEEANKSVQPEQRLCA